MKQMLKALVLLLITGDALAWRCNGWIIAPPQTLYEVGQKCGEPQYSENRTEWLVQLVYQQQCQALVEPVPPPVPAAGGGAAQAPKAPPKPPPQPRTVCNTVPFYVSVPVDVTVLYYDDNVPKALHFENGYLQWIEDLWNLRHR